MNTQFKKISINFDINQKELWNHGFVKGTELKAYELIKKDLKKLGYNKRQQSSYQSKVGISIFEAYKNIDALCSNLPWFVDCVEKITATPENAIFDLTPYIKDLPNQESMLDFNQPEETSSRKALHFDLSMEEVDKYYSYRGRPYQIINRVLLKNGWKRQQGSGYVTDKEYRTDQLRDLIRKLNDEMPHFPECVKVMDITYLEQQWDMIPFIRNNYGQPLIDMNQSQPKTINQQTSISTKKKNFVME